MLHRYALMIVLAAVAACSWSRGSGGDLPAAPYACGPELGEDGAFVSCIGA